MTPQRILALSALALCALAGGPAAAEEGGLQACRAITDAARRLACYDALPLPAAGPAAKTTAPAAAPHDPASFGFEAKAAQAAQAALPSIGSYIPGRFEGWGPRERIKLANGQVWQVTDDSNAAMSLMDPKVTIRRGALGAFYLEFEQSNRTARVKRVE